MGDRSIAAARASILRPVMSPKSDDGTISSLVPVSQLGCAICIRPWLQSCRTLRPSAELVRSGQIDYLGLPFAAQLEVVLGRTWSATICETTSSTAAADRE